MIYNRAGRMVQCLLEVISIEAIDMRCLIDTGDEILCISEAYYKRYFNEMKELEKELRLTSVDDIGVEYVEV